MSARSTRPVAAVLAVVLLGAVACGRLPGSGPVVSGPRLADDPRIGLLQLIPEGPARGAGPAQVVSGFLRAASAVDEDHAVARAFLTEAAAARWNPDAGTTICARTPAATQVAGTAGGSLPPQGAVPEDLALGAPTEPAADATAVVVVEAPVVARIDERGRYADQPAGAVLHERIELRRQDGEWRIDQVADGIVISALDASRTLRAFPLLFGAPDGRQLVPEVRWFAYGPATSTRIVRELLSGPSPWLAPAVVTGAPAGTRLHLGTVPVADGIATVELTEAAQATTPQERHLLMSQLRASLLRVPGVAQVRVTVRGVDLTVPTPAADVPAVLAPEDPRLVAVTAEGVGRYEEGRLRTVLDDASGLPAAASVSDPAVGPAGGPLALLAQEGQRLLVQRPGGDPVVAHLGEHAGARLLAPSVDRFGWVWTGTAAGPVVVPELPPHAAVAVPVPSQGLGGHLRHLRVSRDGTRLLVVTSGADGTPLVTVHGVERGEDGRPERLTSQGPVLVPDAEAVLDVAWLDDDQVLVLLRRAGDGAPRPVLAQVGGPSQPMSPVPAAVSVAADGERGVVVGTGDGRLLARSGADWAAFAEGRDPAYPG